MQALDTMDIVSTMPPLSNVPVLTPRALAGEYRTTLLERTKRFLKPRLIGA